MSTAHFTIDGFTLTDIPAGSGDEGRLRFTIKDQSGNIIATGDAAPQIPTFDLNFTGTGSFVGVVEQLDINGLVLGEARTVNFDTGTPAKQFAQPNGVTVTVS